VEQLGIRPNAPKVKPFKKQSKPCQRERTDIEYVFVEETMIKKIVLLGLAVIFLLTSCALPGGNSTKDEPTKEPAKQEAQVEQPKADTAAKPETQADAAPAEGATTPTAEEAAPAGLNFRDEFDLANDNFTDDFVLTTQAPNRDQMQTEASTVQDGILEFRIRDAETYIYKFVKGSAADDAVIESKWISKGQSLNGIALVCRAAEDNSSWYEARVSAQGDWQILRYDRSIKEADPFKNPFVTIKKGVAKPKLVRPAGDNVSKFSCVGTKLTFEINGTKLTETNNNDIKGGGMVGLGVMSSTFLPAQILFDYYSATTP
jgi:hypothetical protein